MTPLKTVPRLLLAVSGLLGVLIWALPLPALDAKPGQDTPQDSKTSKQFTTIIKEAIDHAREADQAGTQGDAQSLTKHAQKALEKAKEGQRAGHNERLNDGVYALGEAIEHGKKNQVDDATEHVKRAIMKLSQSAGLQIPEGVPTGQSSGG